MKKAALSILALLFILGMILIPQSATQAQAEDPTTPTAPAVYPTVPVPTAKAESIGPFLTLPDQAQLEKGQNVSFRVLEANDFAMIGPYSSYYLNVGIPAHWKVTNDAKLTLKLNLNITRAADEKGKYGSWLGPRLDVYFDNVFITSVRVMDNGDYSFDIPLPVNQLKPARSGSHYLYLYLDASYDCEFDQSTVLTVKADSFFTLPHENVKLSPNLNSLPVPFFQRSSFIPNQVSLVVADNPTDSELQAALIVAAGLGRASTNKLQMAIVPASQVNDSLRKSSHLIYVGKAGSIADVASLSLPAPENGTQFKAPGATAEDGVLQMVASKVNPEKAILIVGGNSDAGVVKAAQAVSTGAVRATQNPQLAVISNVIPKNISTAGVPVDRTFASLGYENITLQGLGLVSTEYEFMLPGGYNVGDDAYLDFAFSNSNLLNFERSSVSIILNDQQVNSIPYSDEKRKESTAPYRFSLPSYAFKPGLNSLLIQSNHVNEHCAYYTPEEIWTTIYNKSLLHIPPAAQAEKTAVKADFANYPRPLSDDPELSSIAFVVSRGDPSSLFTAGKIAEDLGRQTNSGIVDLKAFFPESLPADYKNDHSLVLVGKPMDLPLIAELKDSMPAPFQAGSNIADESGLSVSYRVEPEASIGYMEMLVSPWNPEKVILAALGSNAEGLRWSAAALTDPLLNIQLIGNYNVTNGVNVYGVNTQAGSGTMNIGVTAAPEMVQTVIPAAMNLPNNLQPSVPNEQKTIFDVDPRIWIPYAIVIVSVLTLLVIIIVITINIKRQRDEKFKINQ